MSGLDIMHAPWVLLGLAIAATYFWRARIDPESGLFQWIACVAYGLLAGLISRIIVMPVGLLAETEIIDRLVATAFGFVLFYVFRRNVGVGTLSAAGLFMVLVWGRGEGFF